MRIIGGEHGGKQIVVANNLTVRPTTDFAKEGLFNILGNRFDFAEFDVLDLFSGSGSISYEFASRGCRTVNAVEIVPRNVSFIRATAKKMDLNQIRVIRNDAFYFISICKTKYDIIFADPPYEITNVDKIPSLIFQYDLLKPQGILIVEHSQNNDFSQHEYLLDYRRYGNVHFSFFRMTVE